MRTSDIWQAKQNPFYVKTEDMYLDKDKPIEEWCLDELRQALCAKANGDVLACESCAAKCKFGKRIVELLKPVEKEEPAIHVPNPVRVEIGRKASAARHEKSENDYLSAIASGNPKQWFVDHNRDVRNGMQRMKQRFPGMTADEARAKLAAKGIEAEQPKTNFLEKKINLPKVESVSLEPVKPVCSKLKIAALDGEYFSYSRLHDIIRITIINDEEAVEVKFSDIDALCAEIKQAAEMLMKGWEGNK